jgi:hypothetical protein
MMERAEAAYDVRRLRAGAILAVAVAVGLIVWLVFIRSDDNGGAPGGGTAATPASVQDLKALRDSVGHPVYWAGQKHGYTYELTHTSDGKVYVRYLPPGVQVNDTRPDFLTVGTYPYPHAFATVQKYAAHASFSSTIPHGGRAYSRPRLPRSVYFAFPGEPFLYEVYDPSPARARQLVTSGRVRPID